MFCALSGYDRTFQNLKSSPHSVLVLSIEFMRNKIFVHINKENILTFPEASVFLFQKEKKTNEFKQSIYTLPKILSKAYIFLGFLKNIVLKIARKKKKLSILD